MTDVDPWVRRQLANVLADACSGVHGYGFSFILALAMKLDIVQEFRQAAQERITAMRDALDMSK